MKKIKEILLVIKKVLSISLVIFLELKYNFLLTWLGLFIIALVFGSNLLTIFELFLSCGLFVFTVSFLLIIAFILANYYDEHKK